MIESRVAEPMFPLKLFRIAAFASGNAASLLGSIARGGLQFMLIIWLQGIWLPLHGYDYEETPLWAGIYLLPLTVGFLVAGPIAGALSDRFGARLFAAGGLVVMAVSFGGLLLHPERLQLLGLRRCWSSSTGSAAACSRRRTRRWSCRACRPSCAVPPPACGPPSRTPAWCCPSASSSR